MLTQEQRIGLIEKTKSYRDSFYLFTKECLGYKDMDEVIHRDLCSFLQNDPCHSKLILMPRYSFKSTICTIGYSLWWLFLDTNLRVLIYSDATSKAIGFLDTIKAHYEGNVAGSNFREDYGNWESDIKSGKWNQDEIVINTRTTSMPEPSVDTGGEGTSKVGFHYDLIIFDDLVSDKNTTTKEQMDKATECYKKALSLLKPNGFVLIVGTRWNFGDLYGRIIAENTLKKNFSVFMVDGEKDFKYGDYCFSKIGLTKEFLDRQKAEQGTYLYSSLYRNNPTDPETAIFKVSDFSFYGAVKPDDLYITCTCDPAGEGDDCTAITVVGTDNNMDMRILDIINEHLQPSGIVDKIINFQYKYQFQVLGVETNFFRGMLEYEIKRRRDEEHSNNPDKFRLFGVNEFLASSKSSDNKFNRIRALQPFHERKALKFPGERFELLSGAFSELAWQMVQFPNSAHDDIVDSLAMHLPLIRKGGLVKKADVPYMSPAWLEKQSYEKEIENNMSLPKRLRRQIPDLAFS